MSNQDLELATHFVSAPNEFLSSIKKICSFILAFGVFLLWIIFWIIKKCRQTRHERIPSIENPIIRPCPNPVDPEHVEEAFYDDGIGKTIFCIKKLLKTLVQWCRLSGCLRTKHPFINIIRSDKDIPCPYCENFNMPNWSFKLSYERL